jgi:[acyl-carrier-protein] S-malonyltransferase
VTVPGQRSVALAFPGQGAQRAGMGSKWYGRGSWAVVPRISELSGHDVEDLLLAAGDDTLRRTDLAQVAMFAIEMVMLTELGGRLEEDQVIAACAGHSLGEYSALVAAGVISLDDGARLVAARGEAMRAAASAEPGTMAAVIGDATTTIELVAGLAARGTRVWAANHNSPTQVVVSGEPDGVARATEALAGVGARVMPLAVGGAFHSPLMSSAQEALERALAAIEFASAAVPVIANVDGRAYADGPGWPDLLLRQLVSRVRWADCMRTLVDELGCAEFVEVGPGRTLAGLARANAPGLLVRNTSAPSRSAA